MYNHNIIRLYNPAIKKHTFIITTELINVFKPEFKPTLVAIELKDYEEASELVKYFRRPINSLSDKLQKPPFVYREPSVVYDHDVIIDNTDTDAEDKLWDIYSDKFHSKY